MTQKDKQLLLIDLCARLPHNCRVFYEYVDDLDNKTYGYSLTLNTWCINEFIANKAVIKPYLRPMSSMTEDEKTVLKLCNAFTEFRSMELKIDFLNTYHLDYRGLIPRGLALEAPEGMYNIKEK